MLTMCNNHSCFNISYNIIFAVLKDILSMAKNTMGAHEIELSEEKHLLPSKKMAGTTAASGFLKSNL